MPAPNPDGPLPPLATQVQIMQIICGSLAMGPIVFAAILLAVIGPGESESNVMTIIGFVFAALAVFASPILGGLIGHLAATKADLSQTPESLGVAYQTGLIASSAVNEGAAFLNLVAYMLEGSPWSLGCAAILIGANLLKFPTIGSVTAWAEMKQRSLREESQLPS